MEKEYKIQYTDASIARLKLLQSAYTEMLENIIKDRKHVPGDKFIEITASDLEQASECVKIITPRKNESLRLVLIIYTLLGLAMIIAGLYYPFFIDVFRESPNRLMLILGGFALSAVGLFGYLRLKQRENLFKLDYSIREHKANSKSKWDS